MPGGGILIPIGNPSWTDKPRFNLRRGETVMGRSPRADVVVEDGAVSRVHASLRWDGDALLLSNRSETNATLLNGVAIAADAPVRDGDEVELAPGVRMRVKLFSATDETSTVQIDGMRRRVLAIVHADVAGYTGIVRRGEAAAALRMSRATDLMRRATEAEGGLIAGTYGDGVLAIHVSVLSAVRSALATQREMERFNEGVPDEDRLRFRIGVNSGDVMLGHDGTYFGDAINTAARVQKLAEPGQVLVTGTVHDQLHAIAELDMSMILKDERSVNDREMRIYQVVA